MAVCYVETFLLQNAFVDAGLLWLAAAWRGGRIKPLRIILGALLGAAWAVAAAMQGGILRSVFAQCVVSGGMVWVGLGRVTRPDRLRATGVLWLGAIIMGGAFELGVPVFFAGAATGLSGMALLYRRRIPPPPRVEIAIRLKSSLLTMEAIVDTGNRAMDPWTGFPVILLPEGLVERGEDGHVMYIRTAAGTSALPCFTPDEVTVNGVVVQAVVAIAPKRFLDCALVPWALCAERKAS